MKEKYTHVLLMNYRKNYKTNYRRFNEREAHSRFIDNISGADLADMH